MQKRALGDQGSFHLQDFLAKRTNGEETAYWIFDELTKLQGKMKQIPCGIVNNTYLCADYNDE